MQQSGARDSACRAGHACESRLINKEVISSFFFLEKIMLETISSSLTAVAKTFGVSASSSPSGLNDWTLMQSLDGANFNMPARVLAESEGFFGGLVRHPDSCSREPVSGRLLIDVRKRELRHIFQYMLYNTVPELTPSEVAALRVVAQAKCLLGLVGALDKPIAMAVYAQKVDSARSRDLDPFKHLPAPKRNLAKEAYTSFVSQVKEALVAPDPSAEHYSCHLRHRTIGYCHGGGGTVHALSGALRRIPIEGSWLGREREVDMSDEVDAAKAAFSEMVAWLAQAGAVDIRGKTCNLGPNYVFIGERYMGYKVGIDVTFKDGGDGDKNLFLDGIQASS